MDDWHHIDPVERSREAMSAGLDRSKLAANTPTDLFGYIRWATEITSDPIKY